MNVLDAIRKKYDATMQQIHRQTRIRRQLNMVVDLRSKEYLKVLAAKLGVPRDVVGEHCLEIGLYQLDRIMGNEKLAIALRRHLTNDHLLNGNMEDTEAMLRLGEGDGEISQVLEQIEAVLYNWRGFKQAVKVAERTNNLALLDAWEKRFKKSAAIFADWLEKKYLNEPGSSEAEARLQQEQQGEEVDEGEDQDDTDAD